MKAKLKEIYSLEIDDSLENYIPEFYDNFEIVVRLIVGTMDEDGGESFDLTICTPNWLKERCTHENVVWGENLLIVSRFDYQFILKEIEKKISKVVGSNWNSLAIQLSKLAAWEFENYSLEQ